jgi:hypothetical protein
MDSRNSWLRTAVPNDDADGDGAGAAPPPRPQAPFLEPDLMRFVATHLEPHQLGDLRMVNRNTRANTTPDLQNRSIADAIARYPPPHRAIQLPDNGAFRVHSRWGRHVVDLHTVQGGGQLMVEARHMNPMMRDPLIAMRIPSSVASPVSMSFIGRPWSMGGTRDYMHGAMAPNEPGRLFRSDTTTLLDLTQRGGVWISSLTHGVNFFQDGTPFTVLVLTIDLGDAHHPAAAAAAAGGAGRFGEFQLQLLFTPTGF